jgi:DHA3 family tetracycline resistance protein-like MFS transporter
VRPTALRLLGPALGGLLVGLLGAGTAFAVDAASFGFCAAAVAAMEPQLAAGPEATTTSAAVLDGLRFVRRHVWLWGTLASAAIAYLLFLGPTEVLLPYLVKNNLHGSPADLGIVLAAGGVGAIAAAAWMGQRREPRRPITAIYACWTVATLAVVGYALGRTVPQLMLACLLFNALEAAGTIVWATVKQRHVPAELLGRVSSLDWLVSISLLPISSALTAPVAAAAGARATLLIAGVAGAVVTLAALFLPGMRDIERRKGLAATGGASTSPSV